MLKRCLRLIFIVMVCFCLVSCGVSSGDSTASSGGGSDGGDITDGCDLPVNKLFLTNSGDVLYNIPTDFISVQFTIDGTTASSVSGGEAEGAGWTVNVDGSVP